MRLKDIKAGEIKTKPCPKCGADMYETGTSWSCSQCNYYELKQVEKETDNWLGDLKIVKIPCELVVDVVEGEIGRKIERIDIKLGHHLYVKVDFQSISEAVWQELWRRIEKEVVR